MRGAMRVSAFVAVVVLGVLAGSREASANLSAGGLFRVVRCAKNCSGTLFTFGGEIGGGFTTFAFRYGYKSSTHYFFPDFRFSYTFPLPLSLEVTPMLEFTPMITTAKVSGVSVKTLQLILRPGVRVGWSPVDLVSIFVEPFLWDFGFYTKVWASGGGPVASGSSKTLVQRYNFGFGAVVRF